MSGGEWGWVGVGALFDNAQCLLLAFDFIAKWYWSKLSEIVVNYLSILFFLNI